MNAFSSCHIDDFFSFCYGITPLEEQYYFNKPRER